MTKELRLWLWDRWKRDNPMNLKYFGLWIRSLDPSHIKIFEAQMNYDKNKE